MAYKTISLPTIKCKVQILCSNFLQNNKYTFVYSLFQGFLLHQWCEVQISFHSAEKCIRCNFLNVIVVYWKLITGTCWTSEQLQNNSSNSAGGPVSTHLNNSKTWLIRQKQVFSVYKSSNHTQCLCRLHTIVTPAENCLTFYSFVFIIFLWR